jgi:hypothetical protein
MQKNLAKYFAVFSAYPPTRGFAPGPHWGQSPQTPAVGSSYRARHLAPPPTYASGSAYVSGNVLRRLHGTRLAANTVVRELQLCGLADADLK